MLLSQVEYFVALARERHFGRAAASCYVSQSTLSEAISKLEAELQVRVVNRARSFAGLTREGEQLLVWARRMLADRDALRDTVANLRTGLSGQLRLGVIPSAVNTAAQLTDRFCDVHPLATVRVETGLTSEEIIRRVREFELDAGIIHPNPGDDAGLAGTRLHQQRLHVLIASPLVRGHSISAADLADLPLCLLDRGMRARQLMDEALAGHGIALRPQVEASSVDSLIALVGSGRWSSVIAAGPLDGTLLPAGVDMMLLTDPAVAIPLVHVTLADKQLSPLAREATNIARTIGDWSIAE